MRENKTFFREWGISGVSDFSSFIFSYNEVRVRAYLNEITVRGRMLDFPKVPKRVFADKRGNPKKGIFITGDVHPERIV